MSSPQQGLSPFQPSSEGVHMLGVPRAPRRPRAVPVAFICSTPNIHGVPAPCPALCWLWSSVRFYDVALIPEAPRRHRASRAFLRPGPSVSVGFLRFAAQEWGPHSPRIPANRQCASRLLANNVHLQNADKLLLFIRSMEWRLWGALELEGLGFLVIFFLRLYFLKHHVIKCCCLAANVPHSPSLLPSLPSSCFSSKGL